MERFIEKFEKGTSFVNIVSAVKQSDLTDSATCSDDYLSRNCIKFVPASGAATRMFQNLYTYLDNSEDTESTKAFFANLEAFPFYNDLVACIGAKRMDKKTLEGRKLIIEALLNDGLNYGSLPKALLKFHAYSDGVRTPIDEHIFEGENYLDPNKINLHFTISKEHTELFENYVQKAVKEKEHITSSFSFQKKETDTLAVDMDNKPFMLDHNQPLYRAGGHGSLIENLNDLEGDIIFIKNIDNVCHQNKVKETIDSKKKLASIGYEVKQEIDDYIHSILANAYDLREIQSFISDKLHITLKADLTKEMALNFLDRPLRVCGMVKSLGETGGGPFIVDNGDYLDLQICETVELDVNSPSCKEMMSESEYFNPVDVVCFVKNYEGKKYNLLDFVNEDRYFISEKSFKGRKLKALEHPGLWNGSMHHWNTLFVEVPLITFNPVKTVNDLLRDGHVG